MWTPALKQEKHLKNADALRDVFPLFIRLTNAFGSNAEVARLLDVDPAMVSRWRKGTAEISSDMKGRIIDLHDVFNRALQVFRPKHAMLWLVGSEPFFGGARPLDVLVRRGVTPLIEALAAIEADGYA
jgi:uncharacterized protein (DUF2384 family)